MGKREMRIRGYKERLHKIYRDYNDRQLLELVAYSLKYLSIGISIFMFFVLMKLWGVF